MTAYIVRRLLQTVVMLFVLSIVFFLLVRYTPTSACYQQLGCQELMKLDEPITAQYVSYLSNLIHANFGFSTSGTPVSTLILQALPATLVLVSVSLTLQQLIALPLGMLAAIRQYSRFDQILTFVSYLFLSMPALVLGNLLVVIVAQKLGWFPAGHSTDPALSPIGSTDWLAALRQDPGYILGDLVRHLVLPAFVLASGGIAIDSRFMRGAMLQVLQQDYIRTARAKGVPHRLILFKHAFRNALLPIITNLGLYLPALVGGVIVVERAFTYDGIGAFFQDASDFPVMQAMLFFSSIAVLLANLLADIGYAMLDPRIRYDTGAGA